MPTGIGELILSAYAAAAGLTAAETTALISSTVLTIGSTSIGTAGLVGTIALEGAALGLSALLSPSAVNQAQKQTIKQPVPNRRNCIGRNKVGGPYALLKANSTWLYQVILLNHGESDGIDTHWLGNRQVTLDGTGRVTAIADAQGNALPNNIYFRHGFYFARIDIKLGTDTQTAVDLTTTGLPGTVWTSDHRLLGVTYAAVRLLSPETQDFTKVYPSGLPAYNATLRGRKLYDPRKDTTVGGSGSHRSDDSSTWEFSNNAALAILFYVTSPDGMRLGFDAVMPAIADWMDAADVCDETVTFKDATTHARYQLDFVYDLTQAPRDVLPTLLLGCDGWLFMKADGSVSLKVGKWEAPTVTLGPDVITSVQFQRGNGPLRTANEIRATYIDPAQAYQAREAQPLRDEDDISVRGLISKSYDLGMLRSENAAARIMKLIAARLNPRWTGTITTNFGGLDAIGERRVTINYPRRAINETFEITSGPKIDMQAGTLTFGVQSIASTAYDFDASTEEGDPLPVANPIPNSDVEDPQNFAVIVEPYALTGTTISAILSASWSAPTQASLSAHVDYRVHDAGVSDDDAEWFPMLDVDNTLRVARSGQMSEGVYDARMHFTDPQGQDGDFAYVRGVIVHYDGDTGPVATATDDSGAPFVDDSGHGFNTP